MLAGELAEGATSVRARPAGDRLARRSIPVLIASLAGAACTGTHESAVRADYDRTARARARPADAATPGARLGPELRDYLAYAAEQSPEVRGSFERWRASVHRISPARRLPDPMLEVGVYVWNSGENAGLMPARVGIRQEFPWPSKLGAGADAASAEARALQRRFEAQLLALRQRVAEAYFRLWLLRRTRTIEREQLEILRGLSESSLGNLTTGSANLADQLQIDLAAARLGDALAALDEQERAAEAQLRAAVGAPPGSATPTPGDAPAPALPAESDAALHQAAESHPSIESMVLMGDAADAMAQSERADRLPGFAVGVEWMRMPGPMGESAILPSVGIRLPLWQGSYAEGARAAEAEAAAQRAEGHAAVQRAHAELEDALAMLRDSVRRVELNEHTLLPQAEAAYTSVLGAYVTNRSTVAASLLAQRDLLEIRLGLEQARAEHALAWARLEQIVGRPIQRRAPAPKGAR
jgi:outer membrane protein, heavy metal efflux system